MSGVSIANQLINVFTITTFGAMAAIGIFLTQYKGSEDKEGILNCIRLKLYLSVILSVSIFVVANLWGRDLIGLFLNAEIDDPADIEATLNYGFSYLKIMVPGFVMFELSQVISSSLRECGDTVAAMISSIVAVAVNAFLNYVLIFGKFGAPVLGTDGAAIATVISRVFELAVLVIYIISKEENHYYYEMFSVGKAPSELLDSIFRKGSPLLINEVLYSAGVAGIAQCYAVRGLEAVAAFNISSTVSNLFYVACYAMGTATSIVVGMSLGRNDIEESRLNATRMIFADFAVSFVFGVLMFFTASAFPHIYNTSESVRALAAEMLRIFAWHLPLQGIYMSCYFILRSGGKTILTFLFDGFSVIAIIYPVAFLLSRFTSMGVIGIFMVVNLIDLPKGIIGIRLVDKGVWVQNIVTFEE